MEQVLSTAYILVIAHKHELAQKTADNLQSVIPPPYQIKTASLHSHLAPLSKVDLLLFRGDNTPCRHSLSTSLQKLHDLYPDKPIALLQENHTLIDEPLIWRWPQVKGILPFDYPSQRIQTALEHLLNNQLWLPRSFLEKAFSLYRLDNIANLKSTLHPRENITEKEQQVLSLLVSGAKNQEIARSMSVQETTIKTHLYNLYKKLQVRNRQEAANWARYNLPLLRNQE